jgi:hypothetical protein
MSANPSSSAPANRTPVRGLVGGPRGRARRPHLPAVRLKPPSRVEANARLTASAGMVILILLLAELVTVVLGAVNVLSLHVAIGLILVPPVLVKLASTTWRMVNYYLAAAAYEHRGPPPTLARVLGPILSLAIVLVLASGGALILGPSSLHRTALQVHRVTPYLALILIVAHLATHLTKALRLAARDWVNRQGATFLVRARWTVIVGSVLLGALFALTFAGHAEPYLHQYYGR